MSAMSTPKMPQIAWNLSMSPLLAEPDRKQYCDEAMATLLKAFSAPLPSLSFAASKPSVNKALPQLPSHSIPAPPPEDPVKPAQTCRSQSPQRQHSLSVSKQIVTLVNLLEKLDTDMTGEVQRVKENIKEARDLITEYKKERRERRRCTREKMRAEKRLTLGVDSDFWAGV